MKRRLTFTGGPADGMTVDYHLADWPPTRVAYVNAVPGKGVACAHVSDAVALSMAAGTSPTPGLARYHLASSDARTARYEAVEAGR